MSEKWQYFKWFCPNCGELVFGYINSNGKIKVRCKKCTCDQIKALIKFDGRIFSDIVKTVFVNSDDTVMFEIISGLRLEVRI